MSSIGIVTCGGFFDSCLTSRVVTGDTAAETVLKRDKSGSAIKSMRCASTNAIFLCTPIVQVSRRFSPLQFARVVPSAQLAGP